MLLISHSDQFVPRELILDFERPESSLLGEMFCLVLVLLQSVSRLYPCIKNLTFELVPVQDQWQTPPPLLPAVRACSDFKLRALIPPRLTVSSTNQQPVNPA